MATVEDIKTFITGDIVSRVAASTLGAPVAYSGQRARLNPDDYDARVRYVRPSPVRRDSGQTRHIFELIITARGWDESAEDGLAAMLEAAAVAVIAAYDGALALFIAGLPNVQVERVRCFRPDPLDVPAYNARGVTLGFELDEMEP